MSVRKESPYLQTFIPNGAPLAMYDFISTPQYNQAFASLKNYQKINVTANTNQVILGLDALDSAVLITIEAASGTQRQIVIPTPNTCNGSTIQLYLTGYQSPGSTWQIITESGSNSLFSSLVGNGNGSCTSFPSSSDVIIKANTNTSLPRLFAYLELVSIQKSWRVRGVSLNDITHS